LHQTEKKMEAFSDVKRVQLEVNLPSSLIEIAHIYEHTTIQDVYQAARAELVAAGILSSLPARSRVAVAAGSRGIANIQMIVKAVVDTCLQYELDPFITPAMGSHGGGTPDGQMELLASFGITAETMGVKVLATMEVKEVGQVPGGPKFYQDTLSAAADYTFLINRVKPHTDFHGPLESGLAKMMVIGLGKKFGASEMHEWGAAGFQKYLLPAARIYEAHSNIIGGLAVVENAYDETILIQSLRVAEIGQAKEMALLERARQAMGNLAFKDIDVLVVRELGKNISGTGMDTNIIGRRMIPREPEDFCAANIATIAVLDLTPETHGNASGIGLGNITTRRVFEKVDWYATYTNSLTSGIFGMQRVSLPIVMPDDRMAIQAAMRGCGKKPEAARMVFIENTLRTDRMWISPNLKLEAEQDPQISIQNEVPLRFTSTGSLSSPWKME
jgi:hypothetical protein